MELYEVTQEEYDQIRRRASIYIQTLEEFVDSGFPIAEVVNSVRTATTTRVGLKECARRNGFDVIVRQIGEHVFLIRKA